MKGGIYKLIFAFLLVFILIHPVNAETYNHIYHITELNINSSNQSMEFKGFAFIDHMDNYGGVNLSSTIIVSNSNGQAISIPVVYSGGGYDYFYARCQGIGCDRAKAVKEANRRSVSCNSVTIADCAYFDVEFTASVRLKDLYDKLGANTVISFKLETKTNEMVLMSDLGVYHQRCKVDGIPDTCQGKILVGDSAITLSDVSDTIKVTATSGRARYYPTTNYVGAGIWYQHYGVFTPSTYVGDGNFKKDKYTFSSNYYVVNGSRNGNTVVPGGGTQYLIYDSWVQVEKAIKIVFDTTEPIVEVNNYCDAGYDESNVSKNITCGNEQNFKACSEVEVSIEGSFNVPDEKLEYLNGEVCGEPDSIDIKVIANVLIHEEGNFSLGNVASNVYAGRSFGFPSLNYKNYIYWKFIRNVEDEISYKVYTIDYDGNLSSGATISYGNVYPSYEVVGTVQKDNGEPVTSPNYKSWKEPVKGWVDTCDPDGNSYTLSLDDIITIGDVDDTVRNYLTKKASDNVKKNIIDGDDYSKSVINDTSPSSYDSNEVRFSLKDVDGSWKRTNSSDSWYTKQLDEDTTYSSTYKFTMFDSNVKLVGDNIGHVAYSNSNLTNYQKFGKKYFVPLLFPDDRNFRINLSSNNISFVEKINWYLSGNCYINVDNVLYNHDGGSGGSIEPLYRYRSIDVKNPFPKGKVPTNWQDWYDDVQNKNRLKNTYNNGIVYSVSLTNGRSNGIDLGIDNINSDSRLPDYNSWDDMNQSGTSKFIINYYGSYFDKNNTNSYCEIGYFEEDCDRYGL